MIRSRFNLKPSKGLTFEKPSLTQAQFAKDTDVNTLVRRYLAGDMSVMMRKPPITADCSDAPESFHDALNIAKNADTVWHSLPDNVRRTFHSFEDFLNAYDALAKESEAAAEKPDDQPSTVTAEAASPDTPGESVPATT